MNIKKIIIMGAMLPYLESKEKVKEKYLQF